MPPVATTLLELFPKARRDGQLVTFGPTARSRAAQRWQAALVRTFWISATLGMVLAGLAELSHARNHSVTVPLLIDPHGWNSLRNLLVLDVFVFANTLFAFALVAVFYNGALMRDKRTSWRDYGSARGLSVQRSPSVRMVEMPFMAGRHHVQFTSTVAGPIGSGTMTVGSARWKTGTGVAREDHQMFYVLVELPSAVAQLVPASSYSRTTRRLVAADLELADEVIEPAHVQAAGSEVALRVSIDAELDVVADLFSGEFLRELSAGYDVQWQQVGSTMVFCADGLMLAQAPHGTLDTMCLGAAFVAREYIAAAQRAPQASEAPAA